MRVLVGTIGQTILATDDDGEHWQRLGPRNGIHSDGIVRTLVTHPTSQEVVFAGTDKGLLRSEDGGHSWTSMGGPMQSSTVWSVAFDPQRPATIFAGTGTPSIPKIFRSRDAGESWQELPVEIAQDCENVGVPRVTGIAVDPVDSRHVWASLEVDGVRHSADGGDTWTAVDPAAIPNPDAHQVVVAPGPPKTVFVVVNNDIYASRDDGQSWAPVGAREHFPFRHVRDLVLEPADPRCAWATLGDYTPGTTGALAHTRDNGQTWESVELPHKPNSAMWVLRAQSDKPDLMFAASRYGYLYRSQDRGRSWDKLSREFSEVSSIVWTPN
jgi:photosystem II stability/assembly factor-like uncharacterized protein